jgi:hypothetical protein
MMKQTTTIPIFLIVLSLISAACGSSDSLATERPTQTTVLVEPTQSVIPSQPPANIPTITLPVATDPLTPALTTYQAKAAKGTSFSLYLAVITWSSAAMAI